MKTYIITLISLAMLIASCTPEVPRDARDNNKNVSIFPDYTEVVIPPNIAPCNFHINDTTATDFVTVVEGRDGQQIVTGGVDATFGESKWHQLVEQNKGSELSVTVYAKTREGWEHYRPFTISVAEEPIDEYISYRIIEPSYKNYGSITLRQRNLTNYDESVIYSNEEINMQDAESSYQCVNCHSYQNYHTDNFQFHVRHNKGGTVIVSGGKAVKYNLKTDSTIGAGVYPAWHPSEPVIAYSLDHTVQAFLIDGPKHKIEVLDTLSDMVLYYVDTNEIQTVRKTKDWYETTPGWSPKGDMLYYCTAYFPIDAAGTHYDLGNHYDRILYDIVRHPYDVKTRTIGEADTVFKASTIGKSASFPRVSPDGRYLLFGLADYGYFHVWHRSSDLHVIDLQTMEERSLTDMNSQETDSYHAWSSNGRWIVFSTRREDGNYTRAYIGYFDKNGKEHKPFAVPQSDPLFNKKFMKSFNATEFMVEPVKFSPQELAVAVQKAPVQAKFYK